MLERVWKEENPPPVLVGTLIGKTTMENSIKAPYKTKNRADI